MKKICSALAILFISGIIIPTVKAQCGPSIIPDFKKNNTDLGIGVGFGTHMISPAAYNTVPLVTVHVDHCLREDIGPGIIGVGGIIGFESFRREYNSGDYGYNYGSVIFQARGTYHYQFLEDLDTYAGIGLGFRVTTASEFGEFPTVNAPEPTDGFNLNGSIFIGAKYHFSDYLAAFSEIGSGISYLTLGVSMRM